MVRRLPEILAVIMICLAILLAVRQQVVGDDRLFNIHQIWHHETLIAALLFGAVCLIAGKHLGKYKG